MGTRRLQVVIGSYDNIIRLTHTAPVERGNLQVYKRQTETKKLMAQTIHSSRNQAETGAESLPRFLLVIRQRAT
jgi:hypothetical protein